MKSALEILLTFVLLSNLVLLGTSQVATCIRVVALQGAVLGVLPFVAAEAVTVRTALLAAGSMVVKGIVLPRMLRRAQREAGVRREVEPFVGYTFSLVVGIAALGLSLWLAARLGRGGVPGSPAILPAAFFSIIAGLFIIVSRSKALTQVVGYLVFENGIYIFGVGLALQEPMLVELGILLDVFAAVFVMGIAIFHISRTFDHIDTGRLTTLRD